VLERVKAALAAFSGSEVIVVDDGSNDGTTEFLASRPDLYGTLIRHTNSEGKGAAVRDALTAVSGDVILIQDADNEYWPEDFRVILQPFLDDRADVIYGRRPLGTGPWWRRVAIDPALCLYSWLVRRFTGLPVWDVATCYKAFRACILKELVVREDGFAWDAEVTVKLGAIANLRYEEVPVRYTPRSWAAGKKLRLRHGVRYLWVIVVCGTQVWLKRRRRSM
jgi:glycosyltransferase involved in cell wall biosynthesis